TFVWKITRRRWKSTFSVKPQNGGWALADKDTVKYTYTTKCDIEKISINDLTESEFEKKYRFQKPIIIQFPNGTDDWTNTAYWTKENIQKKYGNVDILAGKSEDIVRFSGSGDILAKFGDFLSDLMDKPDDSGEPLYLFDRNFYKLSDLPETVNPPKFLEVKESKDDSIFFLGSSKSGVGFHKHVDAWNGLVFGQKRWFLYPPYKTPPGGVQPGFSQIDWFRKVYPNLTKDLPTECVHNAGEIFYVPEGYYHATLNIGNTIAVGIQKLEAMTNSEKLFYKHGYLQDVLQNGTLSEAEVHRNLKLQEETLLRLNKMFPGNTEILFKLARVYNKKGDTETAISYYTEVIDRDVYFICAYIELAAIFTKKKDYSKTELYYTKALTLNPNNWDVHAYFGDYFYERANWKKASEMYRKGIKLRPQMSQFWQRLAIVEGYQGNQDAAYEAEEVYETLVANLANNIKD
ncbi:unnamed protein product, partial [Owenia fusiformis]